MSTKVTTKQVLFISLELEWKGLQPQRSRLWISVNHFWLEPHSNRTPLSAPFYSQRSDCCCIYNWPAINASSGRLAITNGSPSTESPLWSRRHWREVYLVDRIDQRVVVLYLFIYLFEERAREERGRSISTRRLSPLAYLPMIGWRRCAVADVRLFRVIWGKLLRSNWALKTNRVKHFHHWFRFSSKTSRKNSAARTNVTLRIEEPLNNGLLFEIHLEAFWLEMILLLIYLRSSVERWARRTAKKKKLIAPHRKVNSYLRSDTTRKGLKWDGNFWNIIDPVSKRQKDSSQAAGRRAQSCSAHETWPPEMTVVYGGSLPFGHSRSSNVHFPSASVSVQQLLCWWIERQLQPDVRVLPRADEVREESAQFERRLLRLRSAAARSWRPPEMYVPARTSAAAVCLGESRQSQPRSVIQTVWEMGNDCWWDPAAGYEWKRLGVIMDSWLTWSISWIIGVIVPITLIHLQ